jgi:uncharacterized glyoxalase superfamily protein PhnB
MTDDDKLPPPQVWPTLRARDARALITFYEEAFGFQVAALYPDDGDGVAHAQLRWPEGGGIMLGSAREGTDWSLAPGTFGAYVVTADPDALFQRAVAAGATGLPEPMTPEYGGGGRECAVRDPEGNLWSFGTYRGEPL